MTTQDQPSARESAGLTGRGVLVHEWISENGGSEKVLDAMAAALPGTDVRCLWNDVPERFPGHQVSETWLAGTPLRKSKAAALAAMPTTWRNQKNNDYDWAVVSTHLFAHHVSFRGQSADFRKYVYVHSPARYIWNPELDVRGNGLLPRLASPPLRRLDRRRAAESDSIVANSWFVRQRIRNAWDRDADVIHPPVDVSRIQRVADWTQRLTADEAHTLAVLPAEFLLGASRLVPYKQLDTVIAVGEAAGLPVVIAGAGPDLERLTALADNASVPVIFLGRVSDELLFCLYGRALAYVFPPIEDFGIMPVEAMAAGAPVIANQVGGAAESVVHGLTGALCDFSSPAAMREAVSLAAGAAPSASAARAAAFDESVFRQRFLGWIGRTPSTAGQPAGAVTTNAFATSEGATR